MNRTPMYYEGTVSYGIVLNACIGLPLSTTKNCKGLRAIIEIYKKNAVSRECHRIGRVIPNPKGFDPNRFRVYLTSRGFPSPVFQLPRRVSLGRCLVGLPAQVLAVLDR